MKFEELGLEPEVMEGLEAMRFEEMTPVQEQCIPPLMKKRDMVGCAQTGTGKTAAYTLPLLNMLVKEGNPQNKVKAVILVPTRELAQQIDQQFQGFSYFLPVSTLSIYGGGNDGRSWDVQKQGLRLGADVVIATPGRLLSFIANDAVDFSHVECVILDEADRMLDMGFILDIMNIIELCPSQGRQTVLFSATLPPKIRQLARRILHDPVEVSIAISKPNEAIEQAAYVCYDSQKTALIRAMFDGPIDQKVLLFTSSKLRCKELAYQLKRMKYNVAAMHSDLEQAQREEVMLNYRNGKIDILVATDIVARGIDIEDIGLVVNYEVPRDCEDYIHRIGRTARASATGRAVTFIGDGDQGRFRRIEEFIGHPVEKLPLPGELEGPDYTGRDEGRGRGRGGARGASGRESGPRRGGPGGGRRGASVRTESTPRGEAAPTGGRTHPAAGAAPGAPAPVETSRSASAAPRSTGENRSAEGNGRSRHRGRRHGRPANSPEK